MSPRGSFGPWTQLLVRSSKQSAGRRILRPIGAAEVSLRQTFRSGQCFRWVPSPVTGHGVGSRKNVTAPQEICWTGFVCGELFQLAHLPPQTSPQVAATSKKLKQLAPGNTSSVVDLTLHYRQWSPDRKAGARGQQPSVVTQDPNDRLVEYLSLDLDLDAFREEWTTTNASHPLTKSLVKSMAGKLKKKKVGEGADVSEDIGALRLLRQDPHETIFAFLCSQNNNVKRIAGMVQRLASSYGELVASVPVAPNDGVVAATASSSAVVGSKRRRGQSQEDDEAEDSGAASSTGTADLYRFPTIEALAAAKEDDLRALGFGYRAAYVVNTAKALKSKLKEDPELLSKTLPSMPLNDARAVLTSFPGIGRKVADCILLFSLGHREIVPIDTHMAQVTIQYLSSDAAASRVRLVKDAALNETLVGLRNKIAAASVPPANAKPTTTGQKQPQKKTEATPTKDDKSAKKKSMAALQPRHHDAIQQLYADVFGAEAGWAHTFIFEQRIS